MSRNAEAKLQAACVALARMADDVIVFSIPNGGLRTRAEAALMRWTGTLAGVPDLCIVMPGGRCAFAEIKTELGKLSKAQSDMLDRMDDMSVPYAIVRSLQDMQDFLYRLGIKTRARIAA